MQMVTLISRVLLISTIIGQQEVGRKRKTDDFQHGPLVIVHWWPYLRPLPYAFLSLVLTL